MYRTDLIDLSDPKSCKNRLRVCNVVFDYNLGESFRLDEATYRSAEDILSNLLDEISPIKDIITEPQVKDLFKKVVSELEVLFETSPLDDGNCCSGIYGYAGLNNFFAEILEALNFHAGRNELSNDDYIIDFVYGRDLAEFDDD